MKIKVSRYVYDRLGRFKSDFRLDTFRAGGKGGQAQNKRNTGVRITDKITGLSAESRDATGYDENKKRAFRKLVERMIDFYSQEEKNQIQIDLEIDKTIRTYKEKGNVVIDHRLETKYSLDEILDGRLDNLLKELREVLNE